MQEYCHIFVLCIRNTGSQQRLRQFYRKTMMEYKVTRFNLSSNSSTNEWMIPKANEICRGIMIVLLCLSLWALLSMVAYGTKSKRWNVKTKKGLIYIACFTAICLGLPKSIAHLRVFYAVKEHDDCEFRCDLSVGLSTSSLLAIHIFLWIRQYALNPNGHIQAMSPKWVRVLGIIELIFAILYYVSALVFYIPFDWHYFGKYGCYMKPIGSRGGTADFHGSIVIAMSLITLQNGILLVLFVYPIKHLKMSTNSSNSMTSARSKKLAAKVKRCCICTVIIMITDLLVMISLEIPISHNLFIFSRTVLDIDIAINHISLLATFDRYGKIFTAIFCYKSHAENTQTNAVTAAAKSRENIATVDNKNLNQISPHASNNTITEELARMSVTYGIATVVCFEDGETKKCNESNIRTVNTQGEMVDQVDLQFDESILRSNETVGADG